MFKVYAVEDKEEQKTLCEVCGTAFLPDSFAYAAYDVTSPDDENGDAIAICQFSFMGKCHISCLSPADGREEDEAVLILGFAVLEFLRRCGFTTVTAHIPKEYAYRLGFMMKDDVFTLDLTAGRACGGH